MHSFAQSAQRITWQSEPDVDVDNYMKAYLITTGVIFGLITVAHLVRIIAEPHLATDPIYIVLTLLAAALSVWAWRLY